jgi:predicted amidohydrolase YtcJ
MAERRPVFFSADTIHTCDERRPSARWFTVLGDRFQWVDDGPPPDVRDRRELGRRTVVPGFVDSHIHFFQTGLDSLFIDLKGVRSLDETVARLQSGASGKRAWVLAHSYEEDDLPEAERLNRRVLDRNFPDRPVWVNRVDYHSAVTNSAALARLEIPLGMKGLLADGEGPTGIVRADAYLHARQRVARLYPVDVRERAVKAAVKKCLQHGITAVHALEGGKLFGDEGLATMIRRHDSLPLDVTLFVQEMNTVYATRMGFSHLGGCVLIDGSIGSYTAALDDDYEGLKGSRGLLYEHGRAFSSFVEEAHETGAQLAFHAIGPRAIAVVLDAYARALERHPRHDHRHRIEHFELATNAQIEMAARLGVVVAMQPTFEHLWGGQDGMYAARLGERWRQTNRIKTILKCGVRVAGGSDAGVTPPDPLLGMHAAVHHPNVYERITAHQALSLMTIDAAYAGKNDDRMGSIVPGKEASFVVLDDDPLTVPQERIKDVRVLETWFRGRRVFQADAPS